MLSLNRRSLLRAVTALPFASWLATPEDGTQAVQVVQAGADRTGQPHKAVRAGSHLDFKVLTRETNGGMFVMENMNMIRGGPPRHVHFEQEEWFYDRRWRRVDGDRRTKAAVEAWGLRVGSAQRAARLGLHW